MPKKVLFNLLLSAFLFAFLWAATVSAQTGSCSMSLEVSQNQSETKINGAAAIATNKETNKSYKSVLRKGMPYFAKLPSGDYRLTVSKVGYKRSIDDFGLDCSEKGREPWAIELYKGSSRQVVRLYPVLRSSPLTGAEANYYVEGDKKTGGSEQPPVVGRPESATQNNGASNVPKTISGGVVNGKATNLVKPAYPAAARAVRASGAVNVQVTIDEQGNVISAAAVSGHPLLRAAAVQAARDSKFAPTRLAGQLVKVTGVIVYNFVP